MSITQALATFGGVIVPQAPPAPRCDLYNSMSTASSTLVGNIRGLENFSVWIVVGLIAVAGILMLFPAPRRFIIENLFRVLAVIILGAVVVAAVAIFAPNSC